MFKPIAAIIAAITLSTPAVAKVDPGTTELLQTLNEYGVTILYNPSTCGRNFQGMYTTEKVMTLCYKGQPTANDHNTVRHEAFHALQHCAALRRGDSRGIAPLAISTTKRQEWVSSVLRSGHINKIKSIYPTRTHQIELEAFAAAEHYSAKELTTLIRKWCFK